MTCRVQGYLMKRGGTFKTMKKRWFRVYPRHCEFFANETDRQSMGAFSIVGLRIQEDKIGDNTWTLELSRYDGEKMFRNHVTLQLVIQGGDGIHAPTLNEWLDAFRGKIPNLREQPEQKLTRRMTTITLGSSENFHAEHGISLPDLPTNISVSQLKESTDASDVAVVRQLLSAYFDIVLTSQVDMVPKAVVYKLVRRMEKELGPSLMSTILSEVERDGSEAMIRDLLEEGENQARERAVLQNKCAKIKEATQLLQTIRHQR